MTCFILIEYLQKIEYLPDNLQNFVLLHHMVCLQNFNLILPQLIM